MNGAISRFCVTNAQKVFATAFVIGYFTKGTIKLSKSQMKKSAENSGLMEIPFEPVPYNYNVTPGQKPISSVEMMMIRAQKVYRSKTDSDYQDIEIEKKEPKSTHYDYDSMTYHYAL